MKSSSMIKKMSALLSAIAASSFLGLPALAQTNSNMNSTMQGNCVPSSSGMQSNTSQGQPGTLGSAADANATGNRAYPNQTDPRAGVNEQGVNNQANSGGGSVSSSTQSTATSTDNSSSVGSTSRAQNNDQTEMTNPGVGAAQSGNVLASGGATTGGDSRQVVQSANSSSNQDQSSYNQNQSSYGQNQSSYQNRSSYGRDTYQSNRSMRDQVAMTNPGVRAARYGDVLASGGATTGGDSSRIFRAANDPSMQDQQTSYQSNMGMTNQANAGATTGGEARENVQRSVSSDNQDYSRSSSSMTRGSITAAQCPPGMMPAPGSSSTPAPNSSQAPAQPSPEVRQAPGRE